MVLRISDHRHGHDDSLIIAMVLRISDHRHGEAIALAYLQGSQCLRSPVVREAARAPDLLRAPHPPHHQLGRSHSLSLLAPRGRGLDRLTPGSMPPPSHGLNAQKEKDLGRGGERRAS
jgi:hypothetical protein